MLNIGLSALFVAVFGVVWNRLCEGGELFDFWPSIIQRFIPMNKKWQMKIHKVLYQCPKCVAGQVALWSYFGMIGDHYRPLYHLVYVVLAIFFADTIDGIKAFARKV